MELKTVKNDEEYELLLEWIDIQLDNKPEPESPQCDDLKNALQLVKAYEDVHHKMPLPNPSF